MTCFTLPLDGVFCVGVSYTHSSPSSILVFDAIRTPLCFYLKSIQVEELKFKLTTVSIVSRLGKSFINSTGVVNVN